MGTDTRNREIPAKKRKQKKRGKREKFFPKVRPPEASGVDGRSPGAEGRGAGGHKASGGNSGRGSAAGGSCRANRNKEDETNKCD